MAKTKIALSMVEGLPDVASLPDHPQYHTDARGDARYPRLGQLMQWLGERLWHKGGLKHGL